jgi:hypothetical protein
LRCWSLIVRRFGFLARTLHEDTFEMAVFTPWVQQVPEALPRITQQHTKGFLHVR